MRRVLVLVGSLMASQMALAGLSPDGVRASSATYAVRQGTQQLATFSTHEACEADAQRRTSNAVAARRTFQHRTGSGSVIATVSSRDECMAAPVARLTADGANRPVPPLTRESNINSCVITTNFSASFQPPTCIATQNFVATYVVTSPPPPTCPGPPAARAGECPAGTYGAWLSTPSIGPAPGCAVTWSPAPAGTCKPVPTCNCPDPEPEVPGTPVASVEADGLTARLAWTAASDANSYGVEKCRGDQCSNFAALVCTPQLTIADTLPSGATARYRVRGNEQSGCTGTYGPYSTPVQLTVTTTSTGEARLDWTPPTHNADGTVLTNLAGYRIVYGANPNELVHTVQIANPGTRTHTMSGLAAGSYYFAIKSYTSNGTESATSNVVPYSVR